MATAVKGRDKVVLTYTKNDKYSSQEIQLQGITSPSVIKFPRTTQKNLFVSSDNTVHLYDLSRQKVSKSFKLKSRVTSFVLNNCDAYLAAGCEDGSLQLVTVSHLSSMVMHWPSQQVNSPSRHPLSFSVAV